MSIKRLTFGETYYLSEGIGYRKEVVDACYEVHGCRPIDCFGNAVGRTRGNGRNKRTYKGIRTKLTESAEWV